MLETVFSSAARERKQQQLEGKNEYIYRGEYKHTYIIFLKIPIVLYLRFFILDPSIENNEAQSEGEENDDKTDEEPNIKDVMKEAKAASGVLKIKI